MSTCPDRGSLPDPTYRLLQSLPTNPHALLKLIYAAHPGGQTPDQEAFITIGGHGRFAATFTAPRHALVTMRTTARDAAGGSITETITGRASQARPQPWSYGAAIG
jgi:hypothetical protein